MGFNLNQSSEVKDWKTDPMENSLWESITIEVIHIPAFLKLISDNLETKDPQKDAIPETYPLLRAIQYSSFYRQKLNNQ